MGCGEKMVDVVVGVYGHGVGWSVVMASNFLGE